MASALGDSRRNKRLAEQAKVDLRDEKLIIESLMQVKEGRRWVWLWLAECHVFLPVSPTDALVLAHWAGERNMGLRLLNQVMRWTPKKYALMAEENSAVVANSKEDDERPDPDSIS